MDTTPELRRQAIKLRRAEIAAALTAAKHLYVSTGTERPFAERTALEAEDAALALEALRIGHEAERAKVFRRLAQNASLLTQLLRLLDERGLWALAVEASERADIELQALTPWRTATTNTTEAAHV